MKQFLPILLMTVSIRIVNSQAQDETKNIEQPLQTNEGGRPTQLKDPETNLNFNGITSDIFNNEVEHQSTFQERLRMLPSKVILQLMKAKNGLTNGITQTLRGGFLEGLQESSRALVNLAKDGIGNLYSLVFGN